MVDAPGVTNKNDQDYAQTLGVTSGMTVLEVGWDDDCDSSISEAIEAARPGMPWVAADSAAPTVPECRVA